MGRTWRRRRKNGDRLIERRDNDDLFKYLNNHGWRNRSELRICDFPDTGRGVYSRKSVKNKDFLISIPFDSMITLRTVENDSEFISIFNEIVEVPYQSLLSLYLCYQDSFKDSKFRPYIDSFPRQFTTPYFCLKNELNFLPDNVLKKIVAQNEAIKSSFNQFESVIREEKRHLLDLEAFKWAYFIVNTRSVYIDPTALKNLCPINRQFKLSDDPNLGLAPLLDLINHSEDAVVRSQLSLKTMEYQLITERSFNKFKQIFINYGNLNNLKLLVEYGFVIQGKNDDFIEITLDDINSLIKHDPDLRPLKIQREKYKFIKDYGLYDQFYFDPVDGLSHNLVVCLSILFVEMNVHSLKNIAFGEIPPLEPIKSISLKLVEYKLKEFQKLHSALSEIPSLSPSALVCVTFYEDCIRTLNKIKSIL